ncbi:hypothetical protein U1Q18_027134 [Sarracenia purpurea var. burkii]
MGLVLLLLNACVTIASCIPDHCQRFAIKRLWSGSRHGFNVDEGMLLSLWEALFGMRYAMWVLLSLLTVISCISQSYQGCIWS